MALQQIVPGQDVSTREKLQDLAESIISDHPWNDPYLTILFVSDLPFREKQIAFQFTHYDSRPSRIRKVFKELLKMYGDPESRFYLTLPYGEARIDGNGLEDLRELQEWFVRPFFDYQFGFRPNHDLEPSNGMDYYRVSLSFHEALILRKFPPLRMDSFALRDLKDYDSNLYERVMVPKLVE